MSSEAAQPRVPAVAVLAVVAAVLAPPLGIVLGIVALLRSRLESGAGRGLAIAALVIGGLFTMLVAVAITLWLGLTIEYTTTSVVESIG